MKKIPLTQGKFALVDEIDYEYLIQWKWCITNFGYAVRRNCSKRNPKPSLILMHLVIAKRMGLDTSNDIDHKDRNKADNRRKQLRSATRSQNTGNEELRSTNTSGFRGVSWHAARQKWRARITINGKEKHLGLFASKEDAAKRFNKESKKHFGEYAWLNPV